MNGRDRHVEAEMQQAVVTHGVVWLGCVRAIKGWAGVSNPKHTRGRIGNWSQQNRRVRFEALQRKRWGGARKSTRAKAGRDRNICYIAGCVGNSSVWVSGLISYHRTKVGAGVYNTKTTRDSKLNCYKYVHRITTR